MSVTVMSLVFSANMPELKTDDGKTVPDSTAKFVLLSLADHASEDGENAYIGIRRICQKTNFSTSTVCNAINALREAGFITLVGKSNKDTNNYTINIDRLQPLKFQPLESHDSSHRNHSVSAAETNPSINHQENIIDSANKTVDYILQSTLSPKAIQDAIRDYFRLTPRWQNKYEREWMQWAIDEAKVTPEQIRAASERWRSDKRFNWAVPTLKGILEHWLELVAPEVSETVHTQDRSHWL